MSIDHQCIHDAWWGEFRSDIKTIKSDIGEIKTKLNGKDGIVVQSQLNKSSISRLWWLVGGVLFVFIATGVKAWFF